MFAIIAGLFLANVNARIGLEYGRDAARSVLGAIAGGMITFTGFVFSILLPAVQFGSSQFSPRLLSWFLRSPSTRIAFGVFCATFIYSLLVLRTVGTAVHENLVRLGREARTLINKLYPEPFGTVTPDVDIPTASTQVVTFAGEPGVLQSIDRRGLVAIARDADVVIDLVPPVGALIAEGVPLFRVHGARPVNPKRLQSAVAIGDERALDQVELLLRELVRRRLKPGIVHDVDGQPRLRYPAPWTSSWPSSNRISAGHSPTTSTAGRPELATGKASVRHTGGSPSLPVDAVR